MRKEGECDMKVLISGYYGFDNAGDEAVLYAIVKALREANTNIEITVLSNQPEKTSEQLGIEAVDRWNILNVIKSVKNCDVFISGGGSLLQDITSKNSILYYLGLIKLAKIMRKKVMIYAQGVGPITIKRNRSLTRKILNKVDVITVRDLDSRMQLMQLGVYREVLVCSDPVMGISADAINAEDGKRLLQESGLQDFNKPIVMVAARNWNGEEKLYTEVASYCEDLIQKDWQVVFLPFHYPSDVEAGEKIAAKIQNKDSVVVLNDNYTPLETMAILKNGELILGMRLHSLIMGAALQKPLIALSYDPKVSSFMQMLRQRETYAIEKVSASNLVAATQRLQNRTEKEIAMQEELVEIMARQSKEPVELLMQLF